MEQQQQKPQVTKSPYHQQLELARRLTKELAPFTFDDLPLTPSEDVLFSHIYVFQRILGAGSFGIVIAAIEKAHLEQCAIKVIQCCNNCNR